jgi:hypothetical protein
MEAAIANGQPQVNRRDLELQLQAALTTGYQPTLPIWAMYTDAAYLPQLYILRDIELMLTHPIVNAALGYHRGGLAGAQIVAESEVPEVQEFAQDHCDRFWERGLPIVQKGDEYGWLGSEPIYAEEKGYLVWKGLLPFAPLDTTLLTAAHKMVGMRVKNVAEKGSVDLWAASPDIPCKGLWYAHNPRWHRFYGRSQLFGAWRPWRRLAWKDGAESVVDLGIYRYGVPPIAVKYPEEDLQVSATAGTQPPGTTLDSQGKPRRYARDLARFIAEQLKSGAGVGLPSSKYPTDQGGGDKWGLEVPKTTLNVTGLIEYVKYLQDQICYGIGVPPELLAAAETGSGYSGRKLPMESFLMQQQKIANAILELFVLQILRPLVRWNFGPNVMVKASVKNLLERTRQMATGASVAAPGAMGGAGNNPDRPDQVAGPNPPVPGGPPAGQPMLSLGVVSDRIKRIAEAIRRAA